MSLTRITSELITDGTISTDDLSSTTVTSISGSSLFYAGGGAGCNNYSTAPGAEVDFSLGGDGGRSGGNSAGVNAPSAPQTASVRAISGRVNSGGGGGGGFGRHPDLGAPFNSGANGSSGVVILKFTKE